MRTGKSGSASEGDRVSPAPGTADEVPPKLLQTYTPHKANACFQGQPRWLLEFKGTAPLSVQTVIRS